MFPASENKKKFMPCFAFIGDRPKSPVPKASIIKNLPGGQICNGVALKIDQL